MSRHVRGKTDGLQSASCDDQRRADLRGSVNVAAEAPDGVQMLSVASFDMSV